MKRKLVRLMVYLFLICLIGFLCSTLIFRVPAGSTKRFEAEVRYQMIELGQGDLVRYAIESVLRNRRVFLNSDEVPWVYVNSDDFTKCWPTESPFYMDYTVKVTFEARQLWLVNGLTVATVLDTNHISGNPYITK